MIKTFSTKWRASRQPRKQRKYRHKIPLHLRRKFLTIHISKDLAKKHNIKRISVRTGDKVKVLRGKFKGKEGKVESADLKKSKVVISGIEILKKDGSKSRPLIHASNLLITDFVLDDKRRLKRKQTKQTKQAKEDANEAKKDVRKETEEAKKETKEVKVEKKGQEGK